MMQHLYLLVSFEILWNFFLTHLTPGNKELFENAFQRVIIAIHFCELLESRFMKCPVQAGAPQST